MQAVARVAQENDGWKPAEGSEKLIRAQRRTGPPGGIASRVLLHTRVAAVTHLGHLNLEALAHSLELSPDVLERLIDLQGREYRDIAHTATPTVRKKVDDGDKQQQEPRCTSHVAGSPRLVEAVLHIHCIHEGWGG